MLRPKKKLEDIISLEIYGATYGGDKYNYP